MTVVYQPSQNDGPHECPIDFLHAPYIYMIEGTVVRCDECGQHWIGYVEGGKYDKKGAGCVSNYTQWRHETKWERRKRLRGKRT